MLDAEGHVKLIDFNLSRAGFHKFNKRTDSFCGSYAYMPPEIINHKLYGKDVDWYLVGVLLYEMLTGLPPYFNKDLKIIQKNILSNKLQITEELSTKCRNLLKLLLNKDPNKRLGFKNGASEILKHPWFQGITIEEIENMNIEGFGAHLSKAPEIIEKEIS